MNGLDLQGLLLRPVALQDQGARPSGASASCGSQLKQLRMDRIVDTTDSSLSDMQRAGRRNQPFHGGIGVVDAALRIYDCDALAQAV